MDVYILAGQDNAQGKGVIEHAPLAFRAVDRKSVLFYQAQNEEVNNATSEIVFGDWVPMQLGKTSTSTNLFGCEFGIVDAMLAHPVYTNNFAFIKYAVGATSLATHWHPNNNLLAQNLVKVFADAKAKNPAIKLKGIFWFQGESDYRQAYLVKYGERLRELVAFWREEFELPQLPFVVIGSWMLPPVAPSNLATNKNPVAPSNIGAELKPKAPQDVLAQTTPQAPSDVASNYYPATPTQFKVYTEDPDFNFPTDFDPSIGAHEIILLERTFNGRYTPLWYEVGSIWQTTGISSDQSLVRAEDPNYPRATPYAGGANASSGNWGWFAIADRGTKWDFAKSTA